MEGTVIGFIIWAAAGLLFIIIGIRSARSEKPVGFWANAEMFEVTDVKAYNRAVGRLFKWFGIVFTLFGLPLLTDRIALFIITMLGVVMETLALMVIYTQAIERRYRKK